MCLNADLNRFFQTIHQTNSLYTWECWDYKYKSGHWFEKEAPFNICVSYALVYGNACSSLCAREVRTVCSVCWQLGLTGSRPLVGPWKLLRAWSNCETTHPPLSPISKCNFESQPEFYKVQVGQRRGPENRRDELWEKRYQRRIYSG